MNFFYRLYKIRFTTAFILTLPLVMIMLWFTASAFYEFNRYKKTIHPELNLTLKSFQFFLNTQLLHTIVSTTASGLTSPSPIPVFNLIIPVDSYSRLTDNLPSSGKSQYVKGLLSIEKTNKKEKKKGNSIQPDRKWNKVKLRFRGDNNIHWFYRKKSWRVKTSKMERFKGARKYNLINPPFHYSPVIDGITYSLARKAGLLSPEYFPVRLFVNGRYAGLHCYLDQINEDFLRKFSRMPGNIYSGDGAPPLDNGVSALWSDQKYWKKVASRNAASEKDRSDIEFFIHSINHSTPKKFYEFFTTSCDQQKFYTFWAFDTFFGSPHHDHGHNHKIYFDPFTGKAEPVEWDIRFWLHYQYKDWVIPPLLKRTALNPIMEHRRDRRCYELMNSILSLENILPMVDEMKNIITPELTADAFRDNAVMPECISKRHWISIPFLVSGFIEKVQLLKKRLALRRKFLNRVYSDTRARYSVTEMEQKGWFHVMITSGGNSGFCLTQIINSNEKPGTVILDLNRNARRDLSDAEILPAKMQNKKIRLYPGKKIQKNTSKHSKTYPGLSQLVPRELSYSFFLKCNPENISPVAQNAVTGEPVVFTRSKDISLENKSNSLHPWNIYHSTNTLKKKKIISGTLNIDGVKHFNAFTHVVIKPGTVFNIKNTGCLVFSGGVKAVGSRNSPIVFRPFNGQWNGGIIVQGKESAGSEFKNCHFISGKNARSGLGEYPGTLNIHDVEEFLVSDCIFSDCNGEDSLHIAYGKGFIENCRFENSASDAIDIDISSVVIKGCTVDSAGNDGIDLMNSSFKVLNCDLKNIRDKGISCGERSAGQVHNTGIRNCHVGIAAKDDSKVTLGNTEISECRKNFHCFLKKYCYGKKGVIKKI